MRKLSKVLSIAVVILLSTAHWSDADNSRFRIVYLDDVEPRSQKSFILSMATDRNLEILQREIAADLGLVRALRARGVQIRNVIRREPTMSGRTIYYLR